MQSREGAAHGSVLHAPAELQQVQPRVGLLDARIGVMRIAQRQAVVFRHAQADAEVVAKLERGTDATTAHTGGIEQRRANARFNEQAGIRPPAQHRNGTGLPGVLALRVAGLPAREAQLHRQLQRTPRGRLAPPQRATVPDQPCTLVVATAMTELQADGWTGFGGRRQSRPQHQQAGPGAHAARQQRGSECSRDRRDHATTPGGSRTPPSRRQGPARHATWAWNDADAGASTKACITRKSTGATSMHSLDHAATAILVVRYPLCKALSVQRGHRPAHHERGTAEGAVLHPHAAVVAGHDAGHHCQAETNTAGRALAAERYPGHRRRRAAASDRRPAAAAGAPANARAPARCAAG
ncbi:hypothetical protein G6F65_014887 [Rhizopus arrhizus]|nr:hypothetical protein G6F65_014887 [Rhizopus arrhizus]